MRRDEGLSDIISTVMILGVVLAAGISAWIFLGSYAGLWRLERVEKLGGQALVLRSSIGAEYVFFPDPVYETRDRGLMMLRNTGKEPVIVFRVITINNGTVVYDTGIDALARIGVNDRSLLVFRCPAHRCSPGDRIQVQVHYIPEQLYEAGNPALHRPDSETLLFKVETFEAVKPNYGLSGGCALPTEGWILVEVVDPKEEDIYGGTTDYIKIRVLRASDPRESYSFQVHVRDRNGVEATGTVSVSGALPQEVYVRLDRGGLEPPLYVSFTSLMPDFTVFPPDWWFPNSYGTFIDYLKLRVDEETWRVDELILSIGFWEGGDYMITVNVYDCNGDLIARGAARTSVVLGDLALYVNQYSIVLDSFVNVFNIGRVVVEVTDVTPVITTTITSTVTETVTATTTTTTTTTIPAATGTVTVTSTTTSTVIRPSTTTTLTITRTGYTTVVYSTATLTRTGTTSVYTTTITSTSSVRVTSTDTIYSPTLTNTVTLTKTVYTTTKTTTRTYTSTLTYTVTVTSTSTTTTTVTPPRGSGAYASPILQPGDWPIHWKIMLYLSLSPVAFYPVARRWYSWIRG